MFDIVSVMVMLFLERGSFSVRLRFFREARGLNFFGGVEMLSEVFGIFFGRGWDYFRGVEFVQGI